MDLTTRKHRRNREGWYQTELEGRIVGVGKTQAEAKANALQFLTESFSYNTLTPVVRVAGDGTIFVARQTRKNEATIDVFRRKDGAQYKAGGASYGAMSDGVRNFRTIEEYADYHVKQYDVATGNPDGSTRKGWMTVRCGDHGEQELPRV